MELHSKCPVCKDAIVITPTSVYSAFWNENEVRLSLTLKPPFYTQHGKILCSKECNTIYEDAKKRANEAYDAVLADYQ